MSSAYTVFWSANFIKQAPSSFHSLRKVEKKWIQESEKGGVRDHEREVVEKDLQMFAMEALREEKIHRQARGQKREGEKNGEEDVAM